MTFARPLRAGDILALVGAYELVATFVIATQPAPGVALWYPPVGIGMAAMAFYGYGVGLFILACDFVAAHFQYHVGNYDCFIVAAATVSECLIFRFYYERIRNKFPTLEFQGYFLCFLSIVAATFVGALLGTSLLVYLGEPIGRSFPDELISWWIGDGAGALTVMTVALCFFLQEPTDELGDFRNFKNNIKLIFVVFVISLIIISSSVEFNFPFDHNPRNFIMINFGCGFLIIVPMFYAAISFGPKAMSLLVAYMSTFECLTLYIGKKTGFIRSNLTQFDMVDVQLTFVSLTLVSMGIGIAIWRERQALRVARRTHMSLLHVSRRNTANEVAAALAHEIAQPISAIRMFAEGTLEKMDRGNAPDSDIDHALRRIAAFAEQAGQITDRLRKFMRRNGVKKSRSSVNTCIREAADFFSEISRQEHVTIKFALGASLPDVTIDRIQIVQVLVNLLRNAIDAVGAEDEAVRQVFVRSRISPENVIEVTVEDSGAGLPPGAEETIFEPYFTTKPDGLGMGLAICRSIVQDHGGRLLAENRADQGASFRFTLPIAGADTHGNS